MKLTMKEIADKAGVSPETVSRVLIGNADVALEKREKVMQFVAAESEKKRWIRHRKKHKIHRIALLLLSGSRFDIRNVGSKIINIADQLPENYKFQVCSPRGNAHRLESQFLHGELDGLLLSGHQVEDPFLTPFLYRVFMQKKLKKYPRVISCNYTPGYLAGLYPRPASIDLHPETVVKLAIDELINRIEGGVPRPDNTAAVVQPQLIPGEEDL